MFRPLPSRLGLFALVSHAIVGKKFGQNANHIKKQREEEGALAEAQAPAARAKLGGSARGRGRGGATAGGVVLLREGSGYPRILDGGWKGGAENARRATNATLSSSRGGKGGKKDIAASGAAGAALQPSWEAKRKMKEKEKEKVAIVPRKERKSSSRSCCG